MPGGNVIPNDYNNFALTFLVTVLYQLFFFAIAVSFRFDKVTDLAGGSNFVLLAIMTFCVGGLPDPSYRQIVVTTLVLCWGIRLSLFLFYRILVISEDRRFDEMREDCMKFFVFWAFQILWVWVVSLPLTFLNSINSKDPLNSGDLVGFILAAGGLIIEAFADQTKFNFKQDLSNRGKWCDTGIWRYSRHPNYFGELLFWWGIFISCAQVFNHHLWAYFTIISPLFTASILFGLSGLPLLESGANKRFGHMQEYLDYRKRTSILIPMPNLLYVSLPQTVKAILLFEWSAYASNLTGPVEVEELEKGTDHHAENAYLSGSIGTSGGRRDGSSIVP